ncbi:FAS-associated death domain protein [Salminus brasiliensis]|uniref:FAS-associated death domain protein n=1 Tax=Salminus brasiliensis TaxID=930266 RepID=UPI003B82C95E
MGSLKEVLLDISNGLKSDDIAKLKFLCQDHIGKKKSEEVESGIQLFELLLQRTEIGPGNTELLSQLLQRIGRNDLLEILHNYEQGSTPDDVTDKKELAKINIATDVIVEHLGRKWLQYGRKLGLCDGKLDGIEDKHPRNLEEKVREVIKEWKRIRKGQAKVDELIMALRTCKQNFTADLVEKALQNASMP